MMWATFYARISESDDWLAATLLAKPHHNAGMKLAAYESMINDESAFARKTAMHWTLK
ncbi:MAG: hypothetical protein WBO57_11315 [Gammaproteobacteria bacterium]